jgi:hypothetical protein
MTYRQSRLRILGKVGTIGLLVPSTYDCCVLICFRFTAVYIPFARLKGSGVRKSDIEVN